jgi:hypothetical protein
MRLLRAIAGLVGLSCLIVALAGNGTIGYGDASLNVPRLDGVGRWGLGVLGVALMALAVVTWYRSGAPWPEPEPPPVPNQPDDDIGQPWRRTIVDNHVKVHYYRPDGRYDDWRLHVYGEGLVPDAATEWPGRGLDGIDEYGAHWLVKIADPAVPVTATVHRGKKKDPYGPLTFEPDRQREVFLAAGRPGAYATSAAAHHAPVEKRIVIVHYRRPDGDYDGWTLWAWDGPLEPLSHFENSVLPEPEHDDFGAVFRVELAAGAPGMKFLLHNGDLKDHLPNGLELRTAVDGLEVWVEAGSPGNLRPA